MPPEPRFVKLDSRLVILLLTIGLILAALVIFLINAAAPPAITVKWSTASELNTAGFNVSRSDNPNGPFARLNAEVIPASPDPLVGGSYVYTDTNVTPGQTYYYQLEEVESSGATVPQGTVAATAQRGIEPIFVVAAIGLAVVIIAALLWIERPRRINP